MAHGAPDYSNVIVGDNVYRIDDMGELAARLGSQLVYDRRGNFIWGGDFRFGLDEFNVGTLGTGAAVALSNLYPFMAPFSIELTPGNSSNDYAYIDKRIALPKADTIGFSCLTFQPTLGDSLFLQSLLYDGTKLYLPLLIIDFDTNEYKVGTPTGTIVFENSPDTPPYSSTNTFIKLVIDVLNKKYLRAIINFTEYDLSQYSLNSGASSISKHLIYRLEQNNTGAVSAVSLYINNMTITINE
jgi:hypothetical protein